MEKKKAETKSELKFENQGEAIVLTDYEIAGFTANAADQGEEVKVMTSCATTSDNPFFHTLASELASNLTFHLSKLGVHKNLQRYETLLLVVKPNKTAELWLDAAAMSAKGRLRRPAKKAGQIIYESDVIDIVEVDFPNVEIGKGDGVLVLFREKWRFGLYFDFRSQNEFCREKMTKTLGDLTRDLRFRHIYDKIENSAAFDRLLERGWFPFAEILNSEFGSLMACAEYGFNFENAENALIDKFDVERMSHLLQRWANKRHFSSKMPLLDEAVSSFLDRKYIACIKTVATEIEGVLRLRYPTDDGNKLNLNGLLERVSDNATQKYREPGTLMLPEQFADYFNRHLVRNFDPNNGESDAGSRHAVAHGHAAAETYTGAKALQTLLTLDQLAFYT